MEAIRKFLFLNIVVVCCALFLSLPSYAANTTQPEKLVAAASVIPNLNQVIIEAKQKTQLPVIFPSVIPQQTAKYFGNLDIPVQSKGYTINIDASENCNGAHYCNVGYISGKLGTKPQNYLDRNNQPITETVTLVNHKVGYFTPGHAMGDYWPANIQWIDKGILYMISWNTGSKENLIKMANSAIIIGVR